MDLWGKILFGTICILIVMFIGVVNPTLYAFLTKYDKIIAITLTMIFVLGFFLTWKQKDI